MVGSPGRSPILVLSQAVHQGERGVLGAAGAADLAADVAGAGGLLEGGQLEDDVPVLDELEAGEGCY